MKKSTWYLESPRKKRVAADPFHACKEKKTALKTCFYSGEKNMYND
jgi:hypothetical protein